MFRLVQILWYDLILFYKHVQTCCNIVIRFDTILQTYPDLFNMYYDTIWYDSTNMSRHVQILRYDLIWFYKHVQTCPWYYNTIWYDSTNILWHDLIRFLIMSRLVLRWIHEEASEVFLPWVEVYPEKSSVLIQMDVFGRGTSSALIKSALG